MLEITPYVCPETREPLRLVKDQSGTVELQAGDGRKYPVVDGIPDLAYPPRLHQKDEKARRFYDSRADVYDQYLPLTFRTHGEDEDAVRNRMIDRLEVRRGDRVLEVGCGTGRDSEIIARRLGDEGQLFLQDIAQLMMKKCRDRLAGLQLSREHCISNACYLPFPDGIFDAVYSFGGLGEFSDIRRALAEMTRVAKPGAKVVVGDEGLPPWLRHTEFAKILLATNSQFEAPLPLDEVPVQARDVCVRWVIGGVFYLIDFRVGVGEPQADFDFEIPGPRGGTYRTRYFGQLEGVRPETKDLAWRAAGQKGMSMHRWLDQVVRMAAERDLSP